MWVELPATVVVNRPALRAAPSLGKVELKRRRVSGERGEGSDVCCSVEY